MNIFSGENRLDQTSTIYRFFLPIFIFGLFISSVYQPLTAEAHAYSASYTQITMDQNKTEVVFSIDTLSIIELIEGIDRNKDWVLQQSEIDQEKHHIEELLTEGMALDKDNKEQTPELEKMKIVKKSNKIFLSIFLKYPVFSPGETISFNDGFYANDPATNYVNLISANYQGETSEAALQGDNRTWTMLLTEVQQEQQSDNGQTVSDQYQKKTPPEAHVQSTTSTWFSFFKLGMMHILTGYDHLLFLLALLLRKQTFKQYAAIVTSFTIAHSITLTLSVLGLVTLPSRFVEATIAFSICYVTVENIFRKEIRHRWSITFLFGLIHGLGFATLIREMAIPKKDLAVALVNFNLGIEAVQLTIVLLLLPLLTYMFKQKISGKMVQYGSIVIAVLGAIWLIQRLFL
ncbi:HupE/UreJ family protein [Neobacillus niacini]|uniref:HupE/UreJ family protein n=1 Tax=Neobacillus niacini TaxID=86668 RepID=UPI00285A8671|nr:HupE/UreJ family protein [Neobacillus niacini]MDR6998881.1 hydrogenase/urease accessory protein HupE [Neobacillus niacini]